MKQFKCICMALLVLSSPAGAGETVSSGPFVVLNPEDYANVNDGADLLRDSFFNAAGLEIDGTLNLFVSGGPLGGTDEDWTTCDYGDEVMQFSTDAIETDPTTVGRVSPCCGNEETEETHYGLGSVNIDWNGDYMIFMEHTENGSVFANGDFVDILIGVSDDGETWTFPGYNTGDCDDPGKLNPLIKQSNGVSILDVTLTEGADKLWGVFRYGTTAANHVGRMEIIKDTNNPRGFVVKILGYKGGWHTVDDDGSFDLGENDIVDIWPVTGTHRKPNSIYDAGSGNYELWAWENLNNDNGCDYLSGSRLVYRTITETTFGTSDQYLTGTADWPATSGNQVGRAYPWRVDYEGDELILFSSSDRACYTLGQGDADVVSYWPGYSPFRGMEIQVVSLNNTITPDDCSPSENTLCLYDDRFEVKVVEDGVGGDSGIAVPFSDQSAGFRWDDANDVEATVKMVDGRSSNNNWWFFHGSTTERDHTFTVTDTSDGSDKTYPNDDYCGDGDTTAFYEFGSSDTYSTGTKNKRKCSGIYCMKLIDDRFQVECWRNVGGWDDVPAFEWSDSSGACYFGDEQLLELPVHMELINGWYWVFFGSMSNNDWMIKVIDTDDGSYVLYRDEDQDSWCGNGDQAFAFSDPPGDPPEIRVKRTASGIPVADGGSHDFGSRDVDSLPTSELFDICNDGTGDLVLSNPTSLVSGSGFTQIGTSPVSPVAPGTCTNFRVRFHVANPGSYSGAVTIQNNDSDENPYDIALSGTAIE